jgi:hypothetical protein
MHMGEDGFAVRKPQRRLSQPISSLFVFSLAERKNEQQKEDKVPLLLLDFLKSFAIIA